MLVVATRRIGDVLLATPLVRSVKRAWPQCAVDMLVFSGTQGIVAANPDLRRVLAIAERPGWPQHLDFALQLARRYDVALSVVPSDRSTLYAFVAGRWRAGLLVPARKEAWKRRLLDRWVAFDDRDTHTVRMNLALAQALGIAPVPEVVVSWDAQDARRVEALRSPEGEAPYAVLHPTPKFNYKMWHLEGWVEVGRWLIGNGLRVCVTGSGAAREVEYAGAIAQRLGAGARSLAGRLDLGALGCLLARAALYVGPDTAITHMAAALGVPTVALYGPSNPVKWGPWPKGQPAERNPWRRLGTQRRGNVTLVQATAACVPCLEEGCERHIGSYSDCLQELPARSVIAAIEPLLSDRAPP
ncbi:MAG TPA: glycosyltransferase family 9 protein [Burkholderiales bacterium]|nr:glycosyltransferase family 9 protein [Burkholderiales bacterium]